MSRTSTASKEEITVEQWREEGTKLFGPDEMQWRFVCPSCGHIASPKDWKAAGAPENAVAFSCVGRWTGSKTTICQKPGPGDVGCNYAGGGLFGLNPRRVRMSEDKHIDVFAFAEPAPPVEKKAPGKAKKPRKAKPTKQP